MLNLQRFMSKVQKLENGCWEWHGSYFRKPGKYREGKDRPQFWMNGKPRLATRAGWELLRGPIPEGKMLCHKRECSNERCVNPDHVYPGSHASNMADREAVGRTSRWSHRYNFVQTPELEMQVSALRKAGNKIEDICARLGIGRTTYYRLRARGVVD